MDKFVSDMRIEVRFLQKALNTEDGLALGVGIGLTGQGTKMSFLSGQERNWGQGLSDCFSPYEDAGPYNLLTKTSISRWNPEGYDVMMMILKPISV